MSYAKLDSGILHSSVWASDLATRVLWVTILALKDEFGFVPASKSGLQRAANITAEEFKNALLILESPDPDSRTPDYDGRRISKCDGGWIVLNHDKYRLREDIKREEHRLYVQNDRKKKKESSKTITVNECELTKDHNESPSVSVSVSEFEGDARGNFSESKIVGPLGGFVGNPIVTISDPKNAITMPWITDTFASSWDRWKKYKKVQYRFTFKSVDSEQSALNKLKRNCETEERAVAAIENSIACGYQGIFEERKNTSYQQNRYPTKELMIQPDYHQKAPKREITVKEPIPADMLDANGHMIIKKLSELEIAEREKARVDYSKNYMERLKKAIHEKNKRYDEGKV